MTFPEPYRARPARRDDLDALVELHEARDLVDVGFVDQARDEILVDWAAPRFELDRDTVVAQAPDGSIAAYAIVLALDPSVQVFGGGKVHPEHAGVGLGAALLAETERMAAVRLSLGVAAPFRTAAPDTDQRAVDLFVRCGYGKVRSFAHASRAAGRRRLVAHSRRHHVAPRLSRGRTAREPAARRGFRRSFRFRAHDVRGMEARASRRSGL